MHQNLSSSFYCNLCLFKSIHSDNSGGALYISTNNTIAFTPSYIPEGYEATNGGYDGDGFSSTYTNDNGDYFIITTESCFNSKNEISVSKIINSTEVTIVTNALSKKEAEKILDSIY